MSHPMTVSLKVARNTKTLRELALETMRSAIINGHFQAGERLVERTLCERLDVSRSIVREVLRHLETEGLVESIAHQGPVVASLSLDQTLEIYEIRALLEGRAAKMFALNANSQEITALNAHHLQIQKAMTANDFQLAVSKTTAFYEHLFLGARQPLAWEIVKSLNARINRLRLMTIGAAGRQKQVSKEMRKILAAIKQRDATAAEQAAQDHVRRVCEIATHLLQPSSSGRSTSFTQNQRWP
jgi:DNA-binding GntR family transcriptional regulator